MKQQEISASWKSREPWTVTDGEVNREWLLPTPAIHYLSCEDGKWTVIDRTSDLPVIEPKKSRGAAIRAFYKQMSDRKMLSGTALPACSNAQYSF